MWYNAGGKQPMESSDIVQNEVPFEPTTEQVQRAARLRRFNFAFVYLPIGLISALVIALVVIMLWVAIDPPSVEALLFISGMADVALIIAMLPVLVVGAVLLGLIVLGYVRGRQAGMAPIKQTQKLLWRMDRLVGRVKVRTEQTGVAVRQPFIDLNGAYAYVRMLFAELVGMIKRS